MRTGSRPRDVVVIGGSAGSVEATFTVLRGLPADFPASVAIAIHRSPVFRSSLADVFSRRSTLPVVEPDDGDPFTAGCIYLAPADRHMTLDPRGWVRLDRRPKEHHTRPAIDPLFESAATGFGERVIGALLTGNLSDGTRGLACIKKHRGISLVHDPLEAQYPSMPRNALTHNAADLVFGIAALATILTRLVAGVPLKTVRIDSGFQSVHPSDYILPC